MLLIISLSGILLMVSIATVLLMSALSSALNLPFLSCHFVKIKFGLLFKPKLVNTVNLKTFVFNFPFSFPFLVLVSDIGHCNQAP